MPISKVHCRDGSPPRDAKFDCVFCIAIPRTSTWQRPHCLLRVNIPPCSTKPAGFFELVYRTVCVCAYRVCVCMSSLMFSYKHCIHACVSCKTASIALVRWWWPTDTVHFILFLISEKSWKCIDGTGGWVGGRGASPQTSMMLIDGTEGWNCNRGERSKHQHQWTQIAKSSFFSYVQI